MIQWIGVILSEQQTEVAKLDAAVASTLRELGHGG